MTEEEQKPAWDKSFTIGLPFNDLTARKLIEALLKIPKKNLDDRITMYLPYDNREEPDTLEITMQLDDLEEIDEKDPYYIISVSYNANQEVPQNEAREIELLEPDPEVGLDLVSRCKDLGMNYRGAWRPNNTFKPRDVIYLEFKSGKRVSYVCLTKHISSSVDDFKSAYVWKPWQ